MSAYQTNCNMTLHPVACRCSWGGAYPCGLQHPANVVMLGYPSPLPSLNKLTTCKNASCLLPHGSTTSCACLCMLHWQGHAKLKCNKSVNEFVQFRQQTIDDFGQETSTGM